MLLSPISAPAWFDVASEADARSSLLAPYGAVAVKFAYTSEFNTIDTGTVTVNVDDETYTDKVLQPIALRPSPIVYVRWGIGNEYVSNWEPVWLDMPYTVQSPTGKATKVVFSFYSAIYGLAISQKTRVRKGSVATIASAIFSENELSTEGIEPTAEVPYLLYQSYTSDFTFLVDRLRYRAVNLEGAAGYYLYVKAGKITFSTLDFSTSGQTLKHIDYTTSSVLGKFTLYDNSASAAYAGAAGTYVTCADPLGKKYSLNKVSDEARGLKLASIRPPTAGVINYGKHLSENSEEEASAMVQTHYADSKLSAYSIYFDFPQTPIDLGDIVSVVNAATAYSGIYAITKRSLAISRGRLVTRVHMSRGEINTQGTSIKVVGDKGAVGLAALGESAGKPIKLAATASAQQPQSGVAKRIYSPERPTYAA